MNDQITVGSQPTKDQLQQLQEQGFKTVVNFRTEGEEEQQPLSPQAEGENVKSLGLEYLHIPVSMESMEPKTVDQFRSKYNDLPKPIFAHCKSGKRSGAVVMMHVACEQGMTGEKTLQKAEEMGFECEQEELREFVKNYVNDHSKQS